MTLKVEDLEVGKWYVVDVSDCCVSLQFTDKLVAKVWDENGDIDTLEFERVTQSWICSGSTYKEVLDEES